MFSKIINRTNKKPISRPQLFLFRRIPNFVPPPPPTPFFSYFWYSQAVPTIDNKRKSMDKQSRPVMRPGEQFLNLFLLLTIAAHLPIQNKQFTVGAHLWSELRRTDKWAHLWSELRRTDKWAHLPCTAKAVRHRMRARHLSPFFWTQNMEDWVNKLVDLFLLFCLAFIISKCLRQPSAPGPKTSVNWMEAFHSLRWQQKNLRDSRRCNRGVISRVRYQTHIRQVQNHKSILLKWGLDSACIPSLHAFRRAWGKQSTNKKWVLVIRPQLRNFQFLNFRRD